MVVVNRTQFFFFFFQYINREYWILSHSHTNIHRFGITCIERCPRVYRHNCFSTMMHQGECWWLTDYSNIGSCCEMWVFRLYGKRTQIHKHTSLLSCGQRHFSDGRTVTVEYTLHGYETREIIDWIVHVRSRYVFIAWIDSYCWSNCDWLIVA